jgi:hypothetical protein
VPTLHYGSAVFSLPDDAVQELGMAIAGKVGGEGGGWVSFTDDKGQDWSIIVTAGIPIYIDRG